MEPFLGMIAMFGFNFAPRGWAFCEGQLLSISQNTALFSLLGTIYGGNGQTTFALPDLRGRVPMHFGSGPGLSSKSIGEKAGAENITLTPNQIPAHTHQLNGLQEMGTTSEVANAMLAHSGALDREYGTPGTIQAMNAQAIGNAGGSQSHSNMQPYLAINFSIALQGIYPSRN